MLPAFLGLAVVLVTAVALTALSVSRRLRHVMRAPGAAVVPPVRPRAARGMAVPAIEIRPSSVMTGPYAYDDGVMTGQPDEEES